MQLAIGLALIFTGLALGLAAFWWKLRVSRHQSQHQEPSAVKIPNIPLEAPSAASGAHAEEHEVHLANQNQVFNGKAPAERGHQSVISESPQQSLQQSLEGADTVLRRVEEQALREAKVEARRILAHAESEARQRALQLAGAEAATKSREIIGQAEDKAGRIIGSAKEAAQETLQTAKDMAHDIEAQGRTKVHTLIEQLTRDIRPTFENPCYLLRGVPESSTRAHGKSATPASRSQGRPPPAQG